MTSRGLLLATLALVLLTSVGCMQRRVTIRSNPPGALVYVDDYEIGTTPVSADFTYYGTRKIRLVKDGYETLTVNQPILPPWYQVLPFEFFADNLAFGEIRDERVVDYQLTPQVMVSQGQLRSRAEGLRQSTQTSIPAVPPVSPAVSAPPGYPSGSPFTPSFETLPPSQPMFTPPPAMAQPGTSPMMAPSIITPPVVAPQPVAPPSMLPPPSLNSYP